MPYVLEIVEGPGTGRQIPLEGPLELGRESSAGFPLDEDELVSRRHARVTPSEDGAVVEDLGSTNGTFVRNDEVHGRAHLRVGEELLVGVTVLELRPREAASGVHAVPTGLSEAPPPLARPESEPDYVTPVGAPGRGGGEEELFPLLDVHTKGKARAAPLAVFVLVAIVVIIFLALR
jgi:pSer/pThr/pTyr-binding forkhead associated (FHA) protein